MKKALIITGSILLLIFLAVNGIRLSISRQENEREQFVEQLNYDFSGKVDSVDANSKFGKIKFHFTHGTFDKERQAQLNKELKHHDKIEILRFKNERIEIAGKFASKCQPGDSLYINSGENKIVVYREGKVISEGQLTGSMSTLVVN
jgi:hypothetical protein